MSHHRIVPEIVSIGRRFNNISCFSAILRLRRFRRMLSPGCHIVAEWPKPAGPFEVGRARSAATKISQYGKSNSPNISLTPSSLPSTALMNVIVWAGIVSPSRRSWVMFFRPRGLPNGSIERNCHVDAHSLALLQHHYSHLRERLHQRPLAILHSPPHLPRWPRRPLLSIPHRLPQRSHSLLDPLPWREIPGLLRWRILRL